MTDRVLRALEHPEVDILAHPTGRILGRRESFEMDVEAVLVAAAELDVAVEINADPNRLDLSDVHAFRAKELGVKVVISTDAHSPRGLANMRFGVDQARRAWLEPGDVLNAHGRGVVPALARAAKRLRSRSRMTGVMLESLLLAGGIGILYFGAEWLVRGAARLAAAPGRQPDRGGAHRSYRSARPRRSWWCASWRRVAGQPATWPSATCWGRTWPTSGSFSA